jgi:hypothetical protein
MCTDAGSEPVPAVGAGRVASETGRGDAVHRWDAAPSTRYVARVRIHRSVREHSSVRLIRRIMRVQLPLSTH